MSAKSITVADLIASSFRSNKIDLDKLLISDILSSKFMFAISTTLLPIHSLWRKNWSRKPEIRNCYWILSVQFSIGWNFKNVCQINLKFWWNRFIRKSVKFYEYNKIYSDSCIWNGRVPTAFFCETPKGTVRRQEWNLLKTE